MTSASLVSFSDRKHSQMNYFCFIVWLHYQNLANQKIHFSPLPLHPKKLGRVPSEMFATVTFFLLAKPPLIQPFS